MLSIFFLKVVSDASVGHKLFQAMELQTEKCNLYTGKLSSRMVQYADEC